jgi:hypothetical protein
MSKPPSEKTQIATLKRMLREEQTALRRMQTERDAYRARATVAEQAVVEWKARFDKLLERTPKDQS